LVAYSKVLEIDSEHMEAQQRILAIKSRNYQIDAQRYLISII
jgi:hypothetical protein